MDNGNADDDGQNMIVWALWHLCQMYQKHKPSATISDGVNLVFRLDGGEQRFVIAAVCQYSTTTPFFICLGLIASYQQSASQKVYYFMPHKTCLISY